MFILKLNHRVIRPKDADGMVNCVDLDQTAPETAPSGAV